MPNIGNLLLNQCNPQLCYRENLVTLHKPSSEGFLLAKYWRTHMATPKKKRLIELMIEASVKWPDGAEYAAQDKKNNMVHF